MASHRDNGSVWRGASLLSAGVLSLVISAGAADAEQIDAHLAAGPRLVGTRDAFSGSGIASATLDGRKFTIAGSFQQLLSPATSARILNGPAAGVRGPALFALTVPSATSGTLSGSFTLSPKQVQALHKGHLYIEIDSAAAPEGDIWGWFLTPQATFQ